MRKFLKIFFLFISIMILLSGCTVEKTINKISVLGNWVFIYDDEYAYFNIEEDYVEVISSDGYNSIIEDFEYEEKTGYMFANLSSVDLTDMVCILPLDNNHCVICLPVGNLESNNGIETFETSHGEFYKYGYSLFKKNFDIDRYIGKWKICTTTENYSDLQDTILDVQNEYFCKDYSYISLADGKVILVNGKRGLYGAYLTDYCDNNITLYEMDGGSIYFGKVNDENLNSLLEFKSNSMNTDGLYYYSDSYISIKKIGINKPNYVKGFSVENKDEHSKLLIGGWKSSSSYGEYNFYSDFSCAPLDDSDGALYPESHYDGYGTGRWSFVDGMLKISYNAHYDGTGVLYHNYKFIDSNTLIIYNPLKAGKLDPIIYTRVII